jgi:hypothetical protein
VTGPGSAEPAAPTTPQPALSGGTPSALGSGAPSALGSGPPPADFSSWYGPAAQAQQPPAPRGYAAAQPGAAAWPGQPQPGQPQSGQPQPYQAQPGTGYRRRRSGLWWKLALVVLAVAGASAGAATALLARNHPGTPQNQVSTSAPATGATLPPTGLVNAINQPLTGPPPAGYQSYRRQPLGAEDAGFTIDFPTSWTVLPKGAHQVWLYSPAPYTNLLVDLTPHTYADMVQEARYIEAQSIPRFPVYHRVDLKALNIRGAAGAFWKFTWNNHGVSQTALDLLFIANTPSGPQSYALYATAPSSQWDKLQPVFDEEVRSFAPLPK